MVARSMIDALQAAAVLETGAAEAWRATVSRVMALCDRTATHESPSGYEHRIQHAAAVEPKAGSTLEQQAAKAALSALGAAGEATRAEASLDESAASPDGGIASGLAQHDVPSVVGPNSLRRAASDVVRESRSPDLGETVRTLVAPSQQIAGLRITAVELMNRGLAVHWHYVPAEDESAPERWEANAGSVLRRVAKHLSLDDDIGTAYQALPVGGLVAGAPGGRSKAWSAMGAFSPAVPDRGSVLMIGFGTQTIRLPL